VSLPAELLRSAAERWGTPIYVTDLDAAAANGHAWRRALPRALVAYAVKANPDPALLRRLAAEGFGFEVVGPVELALALRAGAPAERVVINGVGQADSDLADALATGALVNAESLGALDALLRAGDGRIGLRVNPAVDAGTHPHLATGAAEAKFGIALGEVPEALARVRDAGRRLASIGAHIGSDIGEPEPFARLAASWHVSPMRPAPNRSTSAAGSAATRQPTRRRFGHTCRTRHGSSSSPDEASWAVPDGC
jgi:diaminopimelate decarboxylase